MDWLKEFFNDAPVAVQVIRAVLAFVLMFFLPGFCWTLLFFTNLSVIERIAISIGISIALVTLTVIILSIFLNLPINALSIFLISIILSGIPASVYSYKRQRATHSKSTGTK